MQPYFKLHIFIPTYVAYQYVFGQCYLSKGLSIAERSGELKIIGFSVSSNFQLLPYRSGNIQDS